MLGEEKLWLHLSGVAVFRAERHAIATLVAQLSENHVLLSALHTRAFRSHDVEEGVVGADRDAEVASHAAPHLQFMID